MFHFKATLGRGTVQVLPTHRGEQSSATHVIVRQARGDAFLTAHYTIPYRPGRTTEVISDEELARLAIAQFETERGNGFALQAGLDFGIPPWAGEFLEE